MDGANDRQRKDRLIQTRVPQNLESTLKDEARKRRLSVSHLIRNVLEDTFHLVDNVVHEVDRVVADSVGMAQTLRRDAQRLAATARGEIAHRSAPRGPSVAEAPDEPDENEPPVPTEGAEQEAQATAELETALAASEDDGLAEAILGTEAALGEPLDTPPPSARSAPPALQEVISLQEVLVYRPAACCSCGTPLRRGVRAYLGLAESHAMARSDAWLCLDCGEGLSDEEAPVDP